MDVFEAWNRRDKAALEAQASSWATISKLCAAMTEPLYRCFKKRGVDYLSVNVPYQADKETPIHLTRLERWHFNRLFEEEPGTLEFRLRTSIEIVEKADDDPGDNPVPGDLGTQLDGAISVTPFRLDANGITDAEAGTLQKELDEAIEN